MNRYTTVSADDAQRRVNQIEDTDLLGMYRPAEGATDGALKWILRSNMTQKAERVTVDSAGFNRNLGVSDDTVQKLAAKLDSLSVEGGVDLAVSFIQRFIINQLVTEESFTEVVQGQDIGDVIQLNETDLSAGGFTAFFASRTGHVYDPFIIADDVVLAYPRYDLIANEPFTDSNSFKIDLTVNGVDSGVSVRMAPEAGGDILVSFSVAGTWSIRAPQITARSINAAVDAGRLLPAGGATGEVLAKKSGADYDTEWVVGGGQSGGGGLSQGAVDARVVAGTLKQARAGDTSPWAKSKVPSDTVYDADVNIIARAGNTTRWPKTKMPSDTAYGDATPQTLTLSGQELGITRGNSVTLPAGGTGGTSSPVTTRGRLVITSNTLPVLPALNWTIYRKMVSPVTPTGGTMAETVRQGAFQGYSGTAPTGWNVSYDAALSEAVAPGGTGAGMYQSTASLTRGSTGSYTVGTWGAPSLVGKRPPRGDAPYIWGDRTLGASPLLFAGITPITGYGGAFNGATLTMPHNLPASVLGWFIVAEVGGVEQATTTLIRGSYEDEESRVDTATNRFLSFAQGQGVQVWYGYRQHENQDRLELRSDTPQLPANSRIKIYEYTISGNVTIPTATDTVAGITTLAKQTEIDRRVAQVEEFENSFRRVTPIVSNAQIVVGTRNVSYAIPGAVKVPADSDDAEIEVTVTATGEPIGEGSFELSDLYAKTPIVRSNLAINETNALLFTNPPDNNKYYLGRDTNGDWFFGSDTADTYSITITVTELLFRDDEGEISALSSLPAISDHSIGDIVNYNGVLYELVVGSEAANQISGVVADRTGDYIGVDSLEWKQDGTAPDPVRAHLSKTILGGSPPATVFVRIHADNGFVSEERMTRESGEDNATTYGYGNGSVAFANGTSTGVQIGQHFTASFYNQGSTQDELGTALSVSAVTNAWHLDARNNNPQKLSLSGQALTLSGGGGTVTIPSGGQGGGGLTQTQVDARVVEGTLAQAQKGNTSRWGKGKVPADIVYDADLDSVAVEGSVERWPKDKLPTDTAYGTPNQITGYANTDAAYAAVLTAPFNVVIAGEVRPVTAYTGGSIEDLQLQGGKALEDSYWGYDETNLPPNSKVRLFEGEVATPPRIRIRGANLPTQTLYWRLSIVGSISDTLLFTTLYDAGTGLHSSQSAAFTAAHESDGALECFTDSGRANAVDLLYNVIIGDSQVEYVPSGGTAEEYLAGDNTWKQFPQSLGEQVLDETFPGLSLSRGTDTDQEGTSALQAFNPAVNIGTTTAPVAGKFVCTLDLTITGATDANMGFVQGKANQNAADRTIIESETIYASDVRELVEYVHSANVDDIVGTLPVFRPTVYSGSTIVGHYNFVFGRDSSYNVGYTYYWEGEAGVTTPTLAAEMRITWDPNDVHSVPSSAPEQRTQFKLTMSPASDVDITTPTGSDAGGWSSWTTLATLPALGSGQAGNILVLGNVHGEAQSASTGGGDRIHVESRLVRRRGADDTVLSDHIDYLRHVNKSDATSASFVASSLVSDEELSYIDVGQSGDVYRLEARIEQQVTTATTQVVRFNTGMNRIEAAPMGGVKGDKGDTGSGGGLGTATNYVWTRPRGNNNWFDTGATIPNGFFFVNIENLRSASRTEDNVSQLFTTNLIDGAFIRGLGFPGTAGTRSGSTYGVNGNHADFNYQLGRTATNSLLIQSSSLTVNTLIRNVQVVPFA